MRPKRSIASSTPAFTAASSRTSAMTVRQAAPSGSSSAGSEDSSSAEPIG